MIKLWNDLYLDTDKYQYIIKKDTGTKDKHGTQIYKVLGYGMSPAHVLKILYKMNKLQQGKESEDLREWIELDIAFSDWLKDWAETNKEIFNKVKES